ncbi:MAG TPA: M14 family zinc carboxypeptidase [Chthoniobacteraceae bacterium]|nr:M14 family zinc carboxypeptidase [Chthoniobacteraceae bacterium]
MLVTSQIPNGSGRILRADRELIEVELIAYSKGARYTCFEISEVSEPRRQEVVLLPDRHFRIATFAYKFHADVWVREDGAAEWYRSEVVDRTPERVRIALDLRPGVTYTVSSEPPRAYCDTTAELFALPLAHPGRMSLHCLGHSVEHRPIFALRIGAAAPGEEDRPVIHVVAGEHASESAGEEIARGMLDLVLNDREGITDGYIFDFVLNANPDGNVHGWHQYNARDWQAHNYADTIDRSWHHEFVPYMKGLPFDYSPETVALMEWLKTTRPACYLSMHSWEGHEGNPGAFHAHPDELSPAMAEAVVAMDEIAVATSRTLGFEFVPRPSPGDQLHLGQYLMRNELAAAYLPEGNYAQGREAMQALGRGLLRGLLARVKPKAAPARWEAMFGAERAIAEGVA